MYIIFWPLPVLCWWQQCNGLYWKKNMQQTSHVSTPTCRSKLVRCVEDRRRYKRPKKVKDLHLICCIYASSTPLGRWTVGSTNPKATDFHGRTLFGLVSQEQRSCSQNKRGKCQVQKAVGPFNISISLMPEFVLAQGGMFWDKWFVLSKVKIIFKLHFFLVMCQQQISC